MCNVHTKDAIMLVVQLLIEFVEAHASIDAMILEKVSFSFQFLMSMATDKHFHTMLHFQ